MQGLSKVVELMLAVSCFLMLTPRAASNTVSWGKEPMKMSSTGPDNLLPSFFFMAGGEEGGAYVANSGYSGGLGEPNPFLPPDSCPDDVFDNTMKDLRVPVLPYLEQDDWGCERDPSNTSVIVVETDALRAAITPQWGGKVWSLFNSRSRWKTMHCYPLVCFQAVMPTAQDACGGQRLHDLAVSIPIPLLAIGGSSKATHTSPNSSSLCGHLKRKIQETHGF